MRTEPQPWQFSALLVPPIEYGVPEYHEPMPLICQPPRILPDTDLLSLRKGSS